MSTEKMESQMYRIFELKTELERGKENYEKILPQYRAVIEALENYDKKESFPDRTIEQFKDDADSIQKGLENIDYRLNLINLLLSKSDESDESREIVNWFVTTILQILGIGLPSTETEATEESEENN